MKFEGTVTINAPQEKVFAGLIDPNLVSQCAPGVQSVEVIQPDKQFRAVASVGFGVVKVKFDTEVEFLDLSEPNYAKIKAHGKAPGSAADIVAEMRLSSPAANTTEMKWEADITIVGSIAGMASRLMGGMTQKLTGSFFECFKKKIEA